ncbi:MAG: DUF4147 domain-containing protein [Methylovulum sp.]|uniref:glycerate kinase type-2 family protein n=1 Tax=Methylovulum sp. TaxID=1916980 RepID=UPI0026317D5F|nr:DUF4147 domain-containing protein [Methylovulum sp.]MDD2724597.1 DUF4147 domain-containing protein [Methylovulum sp.]MDD5126070.1 DUF4147 domain-containing protein [Methylovulum sp.]
MDALISKLRQDALAIFHAGITAADPYQAVKHCLYSDGVLLDIRLNDGNTRARRWTKIHLVAFGKAACAMAKAAQESIPPHLLASSFAVTNYENVTALDGIEVLGAGHPLPDAAGFQAAQRIAAIASLARQGELVLVLVSGGGSALIPCPVASITLEEKIATTYELLACGATINEINCVRKHLSQIKGGGLAKLAYPADVHALILSDVLGDDLSAIASGPTVPDPTTYADAIAILKSKRIWDKTPTSVQNHLQLGELGKAPETPKADDKIFHTTTQTLIGSNMISVKAMLKTVQELGYQTRLYNEYLCGEARIVAEQWVADAKAIRQPVALLAGGETTVSLQGNGCGGRNQEMALAFALAAHQQSLEGTWAFLSGGTDGRDGPTDAAGGLVDAGTINRMIAKYDPVAMLANNDSYHALKSSGDLLETGATGTNVADLQILLLVP